MKMSEVFDLPMDVSNQDREPMLGDQNYYISSFCDVLSYQDGKGIKRAEAAALAINCHDELVQSLEFAIERLDSFLGDSDLGSDRFQHLDSKQLESLMEVLAKARGDK